ncbi:phosphate acyltransferase PlsX [Clostridium sp. C8-1-8]|uniref:phosphate acyltransferase PlsX n=1 Tax=Clostridium sp. C8-1-8 TaxID=2698831 RepID=UPI0013689BCA|nr:phosphate acyltransferase PlsX [Clostridium sp. C8-1-8]
MRIAIDGMGGDNAPSAIVEGCVMALKEFNDVEIVITGPEDVITGEFSKYDYDKSRVTILNATEVIGTNEHPVMALRKKKDSSLNKALKLVKDKECDAVISSGSTGAFLAGCTLVIGRIKGIERPALSPIMPGMKGPFVVVDAGANVDCKPQYLKQFAIMGKVYYESVINVPNPTVALVNIGAEEEKGNELTKETYKLLKNSNLNFVGNIEPRDITDGDVNVVVCDGFVGNTVLKMYEGVASNLLGTIKTALLSSLVTKIGALFIMPVIKTLKNKFDYKEYGGAPFLGVDGICIKAHGSSDARAFKNAIKQSRIFYLNDTLSKLKIELENNTDDEK